MNWSYIAKLVNIVNYQIIKKIYKIFREHNRKSHRLVDQLIVK